ncbi:MULTISPECIES: thermonuclease family protein [unclassified Synechococcus]|uniref:thermonuclease family protein n=1 Tax=unclassified Synechococcus TaxID=2626047 RepID=UPI001C2507C4
MKVLDGRTIVVTSYGDPFKVRLACIRTPQLPQGSSGLAAKAALEALLLPGAWVTLSKRSKAADGVELAEIIPVGSRVPINLSLVQVGLATLDRQAASPCHQEIYREAEMRAQAMQLGLWWPSPGTR